LLCSAEEQNFLAAFYQQWKKEGILQLWIGASGLVGAFYITKMWVPYEAERQNKQSNSILTGLTNPG